MRQYNCCDATSIYMYLCQAISPESHSTKRTGAPINPGIQKASSPCLKTGAPISPGMWLHSIHSIQSMGYRSQPRSQDRGGGAGNDDTARLTRLCQWHQSHWTGPAHSSRGYQSQTDSRLPEWLSQSDLLNKQKRENDHCNKLKVHQNCMQSVTAIRVCKCGFRYLL